APLLEGGARQARPGPRQGSQTTRQAPGPEKAGLATAKGPPHARQALRAGQVTGGYPEAPLHGSSSDHEGIGNSIPTLVVPAEAGTQVLPDALGGLFQH